MATRRSLTATVLSAVAIMTGPPAALADDGALVAHTTALLSVHRSIWVATATRRGIVTSSHTGAASPRAAASPAREFVDVAPAAPRGDVRTAIRLASSEHRIPVRMILSVIAAESAFDPYAVSHAGARGLMQVMPATARDLGVDPNDLFDPCINVQAGTRYMRLLADSFDGRTRDVLAAYNTGPERVLSRRSLPGETVTYLRRVEAHYNRGSTGFPPAWRERLASACGVP